MGYIRWQRIAFAVGVSLVLATTGRAVAQQQNLELIEPGKLVVGYSPTTGGFDLEKGKVVGIFGRMIEEVATRLGLKLEPQPFDFPGLIPALQSQRIDVAGPFSITQPRAQIFYYDTPLFLQPEAMAVRPDFDLKSWEEAAKRGLTLATNVGYFQIGIWEKLGIKVHTFDNVDACFTDVINHGADGCAVGAFDLIFRQATQPNSPVAKLKVVPMSGPQITADLNSFGVSKNNPNLAAAISQKIVDMWRDGTIEKIYAEVFAGAPYSLFLNAPEGEALYIPGPWEDGVTPPVPGAYPKVATVTPGTLTVGVATDSAMLKLSGDQLSGPEAAILQFVGQKLGLSLKGVKIDDATAALTGGRVDLVAGATGQSDELSRRYWFTTSIAFDPDYIYVAPGEGGGFPAYTKWEDIQAAGGKIAIVRGNPRIADITAAGATVLEVDNAAAGLKALVDGTAKGFVGSTLDYASAVAADASLAKAGIGWVRNINSYTTGKAYAWGVKAGNGALVDALNQAIAAAWQERAIARAVGDSFRGANPTALLAPGPTAIGTSFGASKDYRFMNMWLAGPWLQRPGWVK